MSTDVIAETGLEEAPDEHYADEKMFVRTAVLLAGVTAVEVAWAYLPWPENDLSTIAEVGGLLIMMAFKFFMVANVFMHLKWESKLLTGIFYFGLVLALAVYLAVLTVFHFWTGTDPASLVS